MTSSLLLAVIASGFIYAITPGPGVLAVFGIGAARGRQAGAGFLCGHMLGDVVWCSTALIAIVGAREIGSDAFNILGVLSGLYLFWPPRKLRAISPGSIDQVNSSARLESSAVKVATATG